MSGGVKITEILEYILRHATRHELDLVGEALRKRRERESTLGLGQIDVNQMARTMAEDIEKQMGIGGDSVHEMSRRLVADMIRREKPEIPERELQTLLNQWVPGRSGKKSGGMPREMLLAMISQFVAYSMGEVSEQDKKQFPAGWHKKYWEAFPPEIQLLIRDYILGKIGKNQFWKGIGESPAMSK
jgi:hypothetical protein